jgi:hypothetical protein
MEALGGKQVVRQVAIRAVSQMCDAQTIVVHVITEILIIPNNHASRNLSNECYATSNSGMILVMMNCKGHTSGHGLF